MSPLDTLLNHFATQEMAKGGNTTAHKFMKEMVGPSDTFRRIKDYSRIYKSKVFVPPKPEDRVLMFPDQSGAYLHSDGLVTFMGKDIFDETFDWEVDEN